LVGFADRANMDFEKSAGADGMEFRRLEPSESAFGATGKRLRSFTKALAFVILFGRLCRQSKYGL